MRVVRSKDFFRDRETALEKGFGIGVTTLFCEEPSEVAKTRANIEVVRTLRTFDNRESSPVKRLCLLVLCLRSIYTC